MRRRLLVAGKSDDTSHLCRIWPPGDKKVTVTLVTHHQTSPSGSVGDKMGQSFFLLTVNPFWPSNLDYLDLALLALFGWGFNRNRYIMDACLRPKRGVVLAGLNMMTRNDFGEARYMNLVLEKCEGNSTNGTYPVEGEYIKSSSYWIDRPWDTRSFLIQEHHPITIHPSFIDYSVQSGQSTTTGSNE